LDPFGQTNHCELISAQFLTEKEELPYFKVTIVAMARCSLGNISAVLKIDQVLAHMLVPPRFITSKLGDVVPLIIGSPSEVHSVDLGVASKRCSAGIQNTQSEFERIISLF
jgi:hypothetical protein